MVLPLGSQSDIQQYSSKLVVKTLCIFLRQNNIYLCSSLSGGNLNIFLLIKDKEECPEASDLQPHLTKKTETESSQEVQFEAPNCNCQVLFSKTHNF